MTDNMSTMELDLDHAPLITLLNAKAEIVFDEASYSLYVELIEGLPADDVAPYSEAYGKATVNSILIDAIKIQISAANV